MEIVSLIFYIIYSSLNCFLCHLYVSNFRILLNKRCSTVDPMLKITLNIEGFGAGTENID